MVFSDLILISQDKVNAQFPLARVLNKGLDLGRAFLCAVETSAAQQILGWVVGHADACAVLDG